MTRAVHAATLTALAGHFCPALLVEVDWPDGVVRMHSGFQAMTWASHSWTPVGNFGNFEIPAETDGLPSGGASMTWIDTPDRTQALLGIPFETLRGRLVKVWFAVVTQPRGNVIVGSPVDLHTGYFDDQTFDLRKMMDEVMTVTTFSLASGPSARVGLLALHSAEDQAQKYPGDTAGRHLLIALRNASNPQVW